MHIYTYTLALIHPHIRAHTHIYMYIHWYIYMHIHTHLKSQRKAVEVMIRSKQEERGIEEEMPDRNHTSPEQSALASWMH